ncbi:hypothetical protein MKEN_00801400 [Mycena kentingensis (nom. inval.)]|nr:hypothetical protein MKEN_00801400 [Mycena kentingensis (nom. inval.)]
MPFSYHLLVDKDASPTRKTYLSLPALCVLVSVLAISIAGNLGFAYVWIRVSGPRNPLFPQLVYSPAQDVLSYKAVKFHSGFGGSDLPIYDQPPSDAVDAAWRALYEFAFSKIPRSQARLMANKTYPILGDEPKMYMLALDVFHQIHCLDEVRKAMYPDYYTQHTSEGINTPHMRHCLSSLRQQIMCSADVSPIVWQWNARVGAAKERADVLHTCRDFGKIQAWAEEHYAGEMQNMSIYIADDL